MNIALWILQALLAAVFAGAGLVKLTWPLENFAETIGGWVHEVPLRMCGILGVVEIGTQQRDSTDELQTGRPLGDRPRPKKDGTPPVGDVHLRIWLSGVAFDYAATAAAAHNLILDWMRSRWYTIELIRDVIEDRRLPRLPCERLFLEPSAAP
ncbi:DoxX family protein [Nocardia vinacea]|uniref:DoxX family protein n=1 Tax=Nocardia vinacea TaxID=96468 RepID=A0ABZ1YPB8_9NOCA|nr:DoxX family protein [Nocardia vinacea]